MGDTLGRCGFSSAENIDVILSTIAHHPNLNKQPVTWKADIFLKLRKGRIKIIFLWVTVKIVAIFSVIYTYSMICKKFVTYQGFVKKRR